MSNAPALLTDTIFDDITRRNVPDILKFKARQYGSKPFLFYEEREYSYADFDQQASHVAAGLQAVGISKGDKVALMMRNRPEFLFLWFGINRAGAVEVPLHPGHKGQPLVHMLNLCDAHILVVEPEFLEQILDVAKELKHLRKIFVMDCAVFSTSQIDLQPYCDLVDNDGIYDAPEIRWSDPFAMIFTSGTTGPAKGVLLPHNFAVEFGQTFIELGSYTENDRLYTPLPLFHLHAMLSSTIAMLLAGGSMVLVKSFSASRCWAEIRKFGCTGFNYTGTMIAILSKVEPKPDDADNPLRLMLGGGTPPQLRETFEQRFGVTLIDEAFGQTEIGIPILGSRVFRKSGTLGILSEKYQVKLADENGSEVPTGEKGELLVRPLQPYLMMLEYYNMPEETVKAWRNLWFHTGDIVCQDADGFFRYIDRKKDSLRRKGENISSFEVETAVNAHPAVLQSAAVGVAADIGGDEILICVVLKPGQKLTPENLIDHCYGKMANFMVPRFVRFLDALPKTETERVQKHKLREAGITKDTWDRDHKA
jgi:crotonobetaine/carnitine-CoA ligase